MNLFEHLKNALPDDHCKQLNSSEIILGYAKEGFSPKKMLNFGCGKGDSFNSIKSIFLKIKCTGVDIAFSGVEKHQETNAKIYTYNNSILPFKNHTFDFVYSHQALQHIFEPQKALSEIARVLTKEGFFIGQTSQFEPHHSLNLWNFTPYGFKKMIEKSGMNLIELRPGIDGLTLMKRSYSWNRTKYNRYFESESPLNNEIEQTLKQKRFSNKIINYKKLMYSGQFCFVCTLK